MQKIFKKSLALAVSAALCLTAFIGCLSVNAVGATTEPAQSYVVEKVEGIPGETVLINVKGSNLITICGQSLDVKLPVGLTVNRLLKPDKTTELIAIGTEDGGDYNKVVSEKGTTLKFVDIINFPAYSDTPAIETATFEFYIEAVILEDAAVGTVYDITLEGQFADYGEKWIETTTITNGSVTVKSAEVPCEHNYEFVSAVPATDSTNGSIVFKCSECGSEVTEEVTYLLQSTLATPSIGCTSTTQLIINITKRNYADSTEGFAVVTHHFGNGAADDIAVYNVNDAEDNGTAYRWNIGVQSVNFTDTFSTVFYSKRDGKWVSGMARDFSIKDSAMSVVKSATSEEKMKKVAANLLVMGAKAQVNFNYNIADLADAELVGEYEQYINKENPTVERTGENYIPVPNDFQETHKVVIATPSISLGESISFNHKAVTNFYSNPSELTDLKLVVTYTSFNGASVTDTITDYKLDERNRPTFKVDVIAPNMRTPVAVAVYNGDIMVSETATYSIEAILASTIAADSNNQNLVDLVYAIMNYSDAAKEAF